MARIDDDESERAFLEGQFVLSWSSQKNGVAAEATELAIDVPAVLAEAGLDR